MSSKFRISIAPMVDWTDTWFRQFARILTKEAFLYTEMITSPAILHGDTDKLLGFEDVEKPLVLQIATDSPNDAAEAVRIAEKWNYDEINLNIGCPSDKVQQARFGACLMAEPELVRDILIAMKSATGKPVTVKHRLGIDDLDSYNDLFGFVKTVDEAAPSRYIIHSRVAILEGLDPKQNRTIPPLRYEDVYQLKEDFPLLSIDINGGIKEVRDIIEHKKKMDGVMIGREAYENPVSMSVYDSILSDNNGIPALTYRNILSQIDSLDQKMRHCDISPWRLYTHLSGLIKGKKGAKDFRRFLNAQIFKDPETAPSIESLFSILPIETLDTPLYDIEILKECS